MPWCQGGLKKGGKGLINSLEQPRDREREIGLAPWPRLQGPSSCRGWNSASPAPSPGSHHRASASHSAVRSSPPRQGPEHRELLSVTSSSLCATQIVGVRYERGVWALNPGAQGMRVWSGRSQPRLTAFTEGWREVAWVQFGMPMEAECAPSLHAGKLNVSCLRKRPWAPKCQ